MFLLILQTLGWLMIGCTVMFVGLIIMLFVIGREKRR